ncbi:unnamed protein product [marine sediment metagenome]|uniref:Uncharacterized protein n=1 Tax=marine sediment metagenome TaxID=412755 RepID=X0X2F0_9ZZZZ
MLSKKQEIQKQEKMVLINFSVPASFKKKFKITAAELDMTQSNLLQKIFKEWENRHKL